MARLPQATRESVPEAQRAIFDALSTVVAPEHLIGIQRYASEDLFRGGGLAAIAGALVLIYTGSRVFVELDDAFDVIWRDTSSGRERTRARRRAASSPWPTIQSWASA